MSQSQDITLAVSNQNRHLHLKNRMNHGALNPQ